MTKQEEIKILEMKIQYAETLIRLEQNSIEFYKNKIKILSGDQNIKLDPEAERNHFKNPKN